MYGMTYSREGFVPLTEDVLMSHRRAVPVVLVGAALSKRACAAV
jgi:hypothetical protein